MSQAVTWYGSETVEACFDENVIMDHNVHLLSDVGY